LFSVFQECVEKPRRKCMDMTRAERNVKTNGLIKWLQSAVLCALDIGSL